MQKPAAAEQAAAPTVQLPIDVRVGPGPDGKPWVLLTFADQLLTSTVRIPPAAADQLAASIGGALLKAATEARRQTSPLVVAGADTLNGSVSRN